MTQPSLDLREAEATLHSVIEVLIDSQEAFQQIGDELKDETLKLHFFAESLKRAEFRGAIESILHWEGEHDIKESGTAAGTAHRAWADLKSRLGGGDHTLLATAEQGEDAAKEAYAKALESNLPLPIRQLLTSQSAHIQVAHDYVKAALGLLPAGNVLWDGMPTGGGDAARTAGLPPQQAKSGLAGGPGLETGATIRSGDRRYDFSPPVRNAGLAQQRQKPVQLLVILLDAAGEDVVVPAMHG
jgi:uncharacterized protein (TIGR02284 family)